MVRITSKNGHVSTLRRPTQHLFPLEVDKSNSAPHSADNNVNPKTATNDRAPADCQVPADDKVPADFQPAETSRSHRAAQC